jgi:opacity protein-like surface antigen
MKRISLLVFLSLLCLPCFSHQISINPATKDRWYMAIFAGASHPEFNSTAYVNNDSGFAAPFHVDTYVFKKPSNQLVGISGGYRWQREVKWLPSYSMDLSYTHLLPKNVGNTIIQYSAPVFTNYRFRSNISSDIFLINGKLNLVRVDFFSPYLTGGVGIAANRFSNYQEYPIAGLTAVRVSPGYKSNTKYEFAYDVGVGLDFRTAEHYFISLEYQYQNLGMFNSNSGASNWNDTSLDLGRYTSNTVLAKLTYLF